MNAKLKNGLKLIFILLIFFNIGGIALVVSGIFNIDLRNLSEEHLAYLNLILMSFISLVCLLLYFSYLKEDWIKFKERLKENLITSLKLFVIFMLIKFAASIATVIASMALGIEFVQSDNQEVIEALTVVAPIAMLITAGLLAPFYEEVIFRLGFKKIITKQHLYIILTGLLFGLIHTVSINLFLDFRGTDWNLILIQSIVFVAMGITLSAIYWKRPNIWIVVIVHALNNLLSLGILFLL